MVIASKSKKLLLMFSLIIAAILVSILIVSFVLDKKEAIIVYDYASCAKAGNVILETYPAQCHDKNGRSYTEDVSNNSN
jgi:hypothetical protein